MYLRRKTRRTRKNSNFIGVTRHKIQPINNFTINNPLEHYKDKLHNTLISQMVNTKQQINRIHESTRKCNIKKMIKLKKKHQKLQEKYAVFMKSKQNIDKFLNELEI